VEYSCSEVVQPFETFLAASSCALCNLRQRSHSDGRRSRELRIYFSGAATESQLSCTTGLNRQIVSYSRSNRCSVPNGRANQNLRDNRLCSAAARTSIYPTSNHEIRNQVTCVTKSNRSYSCCLVDQANRLFQAAVSAASNRRRLFIKHSRRMTPRVVGSREDIQVRISQRLAL
jgi:hypothetical protein